MIKYALVCDTGHEFESWFADSPQQAAGGDSAVPAPAATDVGDER